MKPLPFLLITASLLVFAGCPQDPEYYEETPTDSTTESTTSTEETALESNTSDFTPPEDFEWGWENDGPFEMRLLSARSEDGINWERDNQIISNQAGAPNMVVAPDGTIHLYYIGGNILGKDQAMAVALSDDKGATWTYKEVSIENSPLAGPPGDPDVVIREDGTFRLYFTSSPPNSTLPGIYYADSEDGLTFTYGGEAFRPEAMAIDSTTFYWNDEWVMFTFTGFEPAHLFATSSDGDTFSFVKKVVFSDEGDLSYFLSNVVLDQDGTLRVYGFDLEKGGDIRSSTSTDGLTWVDEGLVHLELDPDNGLEGHYLKDPAVVQLEDGSYFMVYVTRVKQE